MVLRKTMPLTEKERARWDVLKGKLSGEAKEVLEAIDKIELGCFKSYMIRKWTPLLEKV